MGNRCACCVASLLLFACGGDGASGSGTEGIASSGQPTSEADTTSSSSGHADASTTGGTGSGVVVYVPESLQPAIDEFVRFMPTDDVTVSVSANPWADAQQADLAIAVELGEDCVECYRLSSEGMGHHVQAGDVLGAQIGLARAFEGFGVRFFAPHSTYVPATWDAEVVFDGALHEPETAERGIQLHSLHPVEGLYAFWMPSDEHLEDARRITDYYIKHGVNLLQWVGLEDILYDDPTYNAWEAHTSAVTEYMHARGVRAGVNIQLYGSANAQNAFDLIEDDSSSLPEQEEAMTERLDLLLSTTGFDHVTISFGEFADADAEPFLASTNLLWQVVDTIAPGTTMGSKIHVGNYEDLFVDYEGQSYLFYFLAQFADPNIVPWVHTVMYYNLYEDAGGAYAHDEFDLHRDMLLERLESGDDVAYFPETSYWVAFDNSVPTYLPLYMKSRFIDLDETRARAAAPLQRHITFSSGFEWGYWQNDYATLRMNYTLPDTWGAVVGHMFAPFGEPGATLAQVVVAAGDRQHQALIVDRLAAYMAGRDIIIDLAAMGGTTAQPLRVLFDDIVAMEPAERDAFVADVVDPLDAFADDLQVQLDAARAIDDAPAMQVWHQEVIDGLAIDVMRARFAAAVHRAVVQFAAGDEAMALAEAESLFTEALAIVGDRHGALLNPDPDQLTSSFDQNPTIYGYGYLGMAHTLCYWERELIAARNVVTSGDEMVPACFTLGG